MMKLRVTWAAYYDLLLLVKHIDLFDVTLSMHVLIMPVGKIAVNEFI